MVDTKKFSEFVSGGNLQNDDVTVGLSGSSNAQFNNPWTFLPPGTTAERPAVDASMYYRLRLNTDMEHYEYYDPILAEWLQIESSGDIANLIARLAAHTAGDGASMIGLLDQGGVLDKTVQDLSEADFIVKSDTSALANAVALSGLSTGFLVNEAGTGNLVAREIEGTVDQIDISDGTGLAANPQASIAANPTLPGASHVIIPFGTTAQRPGVASNGYFRYNTDLDEIEFYDNNAGAWVQLGSSGAVFSVTGTANEIDVDNTDAENPIISLPSTLIAPGTVAVGNLLLDTNTISSTDTNGDLVLAADGAGDITVTDRLVFESSATNSTGFQYDSVGGILYCNVDAFAQWNVNSDGFQIKNANARVQAILDQDDMVSDSDIAICTQQSIKAYVDNSVANVGITWNVVAGSTQAMAPNNGYISPSGSPVTYTLPATAAVGTELIVVGDGLDGWTIAQNAGQSIRVGIRTSTVGTGGTVTALAPSDGLHLVCIEADTRWANFSAPQGQIDVS